jgi:hypothetical protein
VTRWSWAALLAALVVLAVLLAWADSTVLRPLFPEPFEPPRRAGFRPPTSLPLSPALLPPLRMDQVLGRFGRAGGLYSFWWFLSVGASMILLTMAVVVSVPMRARRAAERVGAAALPQLLVAGIATVMLGLAASVLLRVSFVLLSVAPLLWAAGALGAVFGLSALSLAAGRWLRARLGPAPPLLGPLAGLLVLFDISLVPVVGWVVLAIVAATALGLAVLTRLGSATGWALEELNW